MEYVVRHEIIHKADACQLGHPVTSSCDEEICSEIRAYSVNCKEGAPWRIGRSYKECIEYYVAESVRQSGMHCGDVEKWIARLYCQCVVEEGKTAPTYPSGQSHQQPK